MTNFEFYRHKYNDRMWDLSEKSEDATIKFAHAVVLLITGKNISDFKADMKWLKSSEFESKEGAIYHALNAIDLRENGDIGGDVSECVMSAISASICGYDSEVEEILLSLEG